MEARQHHFAFAKTVLPARVFRAPDETFDELVGPKREAFLTSLWHEAATGVAEPLPPADFGRVPGSAEHSLIKLGVVGVIQQRGMEVVVISMPPALAPNEAVWVALVRGGRGPIRVFYFERCRTREGGLSENEVVFACVSAEGERKNFGFFEGESLEHFKTRLGKALGLSFEGLEASLLPGAPPSVRSPHSGPASQRGFFSKLFGSLRKGKA